MRVKRLLRDGACDCGCRVPYPTLLKTVTTFWGLSKASQDAVLWSLQEEAGGRCSRWSIEGQLGPLAVKCSRLMSGLKPSLLCRI